MATKKEETMNTEEVKTTTKRTSSKKDITKVTGYNPMDNALTLRNVDSMGNIIEKKYLPAAERVRWFRKALPDGTIDTKITEFSFDTTTGIGWAVAQAYIYETKKDLASNTFLATAHSFRAYDFRAKKTSESDIIASKFIQCVETEAIARALSLAGFNIVGDDLDEESDNFADSPIKDNTTPTNHNSDAGKIASFVVVHDENIPVSFPAPTEPNMPEASVNINSEQPNESAELNMEGLNFSIPVDEPVENIEPKVESENVQATNAEDYTPTLEEVKAALSFKFEGIGNANVKGKTFNEVFEYDNMAGTQHGISTVQWILGHIGDGSTPIWKKAKEAAIVINAYMKAKKEQ